MSGLSLKYRMSLAVIAIMLVGCMFLGSSYALWKVEFEQESENVIKTGCFDTVFENAENSESINLDKAYPVDNEKGLKTTPYNFTIHNKCSIDANYKLYLNTLKIDVNNSDDRNQRVAGKIPDNLIMYILTKEGATNGTAQTVNNLTQNTETTSFEFDEGQKLETSYILDDGEGSNGIFLKAGESKQYSLKLWISSAATTAINYQRFEAQIATIAYAVNTPSTEEVTG